MQLGWCGAQLPGPGAAPAQLTQDTSGVSKSLLLQMLHNSQGWKQWEDQIWPKGHLSARVSVNTHLPFSQDLLSGKARSEAERSRAAEPGVLVASLLLLQLVGHCSSSLSCSYICSPHRHYTTAGAGQEVAHQIPKPLVHHHSFLYNSILAQQFVCHICWSCKPVALLL